MRNTSAVTWTAADGFKLGAVDDEDPLYRDDVRVFLGEGEEVPPGGTTTFSFDLHAPDGSPSLITDWQMLQEHVEWFGAVSKHAVELSCGTSTPPSGGEVDPSVQRAARGARRAPAPALAAKRDDSTGAGSRCGRKLRSACGARLTSLTLSLRNGCSARPRKPRFLRARSLIHETENGAEVRPVRARVPG